ncbi:hypothetical protein ACV1DV_21240, partial [Aeromonas veronii]
ARETRAGAKRGCLKQLCATTILKNADWERVVNTKAFALWAYQSAIDSIAMVFDAWPYIDAIDSFKEIYSVNLRHEEQWK